MFAILAQVFHAGPEPFRTAWFIESMATQILVIFVIRTWGPAWSSRINGVLVASSLGALAVACPIALSPVGRAFGFVAVPALLLLTIGIIVAVTLRC
jgi:Mg2+-importing ATPase